MNKKIKAIILMISCTLFTSSAQMFLKIGANNLEFSFLSVFLNPALLLGLILYGLGAVLLIVALRTGEVTVLYPIVATSYIWVAFGSSHFFGEVIGLFRWVGISLIILGVIMITNGDKMHNKLRGYA